MPNLRNSLHLLILGAVWGGSFLFLRIAAPVLGPFVVTDSRVILGALMLGLYALLTRKNLFAEFPWRKLIILAAINCAIPFTLIAYTEITLTASLGSILNATTPLYTAFFALFLLKERYHLIQYVGFILGILGVIVLVGWSPLELSLHTTLAIAAILTGTFFYAIGGIYAAKTFTGIAPLSLAFAQLLFAAILLFPFAIYNIPHHLPSNEVMLAILGLGILSTGLAYLVYFHLIKNVGASKTLTVTYLIPVFGMLWGSLFLHEKIGYSTLIGFLIIALGIFMIYSKKNKS